jgi:hypothetical protein
MRQSVRPIRVLIFRRCGDEVRERGRDDPDRQSIPKRNELAEVGKITRRAIGEGIETRVGVQS